MNLTLKKTLSIFFCFFLFSPVFSQNVPDEVIFSYQSELELWLKQNDIIVEPKVHKYNSIELYKDPFFHNIYPELKIFGKGGSIIECFAMGKFLTLAEREKIYLAIYSSVPDEIKEEFIPFKTFNNFKNSLIFNPNIIFDKLSNHALYPINGKGIYLIFYFGSYSERFPDNVFNIQLKQLTQGDHKNLLILPYSYYYALFIINDNDDINLFCYYGVN